MKHTIYVLTIIGLLFGCKKTEYVAKFDEDPQVRIQKEIQEIKTSLTGSTNGWIGVMPTLTGGGYGFYITFANDESLMMQADLDTNKALTANQSRYRIKQDMGVNLLFDTYNYISLLNDPAPVHSVAPSAMVTKAILSLYSIMQKETRSDSSVKVPSAAHDDQSDSSTKSQIRWRGIQNPHEKHLSLFHRQSQCVC